MLRFLGLFALVVLLCTASAKAFNVNFEESKMIEVSPEVSPRIPFWQSAKVERGDTFSQYCVEFLRVSGLNQHYSQRNCFDSIKAVNGYSESQLHWIYPNQIVWLPSRQNVRLGDAQAEEPFVRVAQLRELLGLQALTERVDALPDEDRVRAIADEVIADRVQRLNEAVQSELAEKANQTDLERLAEVIRTELEGYVNQEQLTTLSQNVQRGLQNSVSQQQLEELLASTMQMLVTEDRVSEIVGEEITSATRQFTGNGAMPWWLWWLIALLALLTLLALAGAVANWLRPKDDIVARTAADDAKAVANKAHVAAENAVTKTELSSLSKGFNNKLETVGQQAATAEEAAIEAGELASSAMAMLCFGDFKVVDGFPSQTAIEKLAPDEEIFVTLAHVDNPEDVRVIHFTCVADAFGTGRDGLRIEGITNQRRPIAKRRSSVASALANGAKANHLQGINLEKPKQRRSKSA